MLFVLSQQASDLLARLRLRFAGGAAGRGFVAEPFPGEGQQAVDEVAEVSKNQGNAPRLACVMGEPHDEPVFIRCRGHYYYNRRNPIGRVLIVAALLASGWLLYDQYDGTYWSEGELRDAVHAAAEDMEAKPRSESSLAFWDYEGLIRDALHATGEGQEFGAVVTAAGEEGTADGAGPDRFEISTPDTTTVYCISVSPPRPERLPDPPSPDRDIDLAVEVEQGSC
ncbi:hypothetical protein [Streptomyces lavendulocolor]|uniref:hypothetical protein n=1 Tax=Streptomyces lavendulocolor TaxID=67316 RepID=UPI003C30D1BB